MKIKDILFCVLLIIIDQVSKYIVSIKLSIGKSFVLIDNFFYLTLSHNQGAAWGIGNGLQNLFVVSAILVGCGLVYYLFKHPVKNKLTKVCLLMIIAGAFGNAIDRIIHGYVIDFLDFIIPIIHYDFPVFNFADCCITVGVILLVILVIFDKDGLDGNN